MMDLGHDPREGISLSLGLIVVIWLLAAAPHRHKPGKKWFAKEKVEKVLFQNEDITDLCSQLFHCIEMY